MIIILVERDLEFVEDIERMVLIEVGLVVMVSFWICWVYI